MDCDKGICLGCNSELLPGVENLNLSDNEEVQNQSLNEETLGDGELKYSIYSRVA